MKSLNEFLYGVNWWLSSSGVEMWRNFDKKEVEDDFKKMRKIGFNTVRIFLKWDEFQGEDGRIKKENVEKLDILIKTARENGLKIILTLFVGWMSGKWFKPSFVNKQEDIFTDPKILKYQMWYVRYFAKRYKKEETVVVFNLANEQQCLRCPSRNWAYLWMSYLINAMKNEGISQPVTSGINHLGINEDDIWNIYDSSEFSDFNVIHPYPSYLWYTEIKNLPLSISTTLFPVFLAKYYEGLGKKPVICEEIGSLGESFISDRITSKYIKKIFYSLFSNGISGILWWTFRDFKCKNISPYKEFPFESSLGILDEDGKEKIFTKEFIEFARFIKKIDFKEIQFAKNDAAIIFLPNAKRENIYGCFLLGKLANINMDIIGPDEDFKKYKIIFLPSLSSKEIFHRDHFEKLKDYVRNGGIFYISYDGFYLPDIKEFFGIEIKGREVKDIIGDIEFDRENLNIKGENNFWAIEIEDGEDKILFENNYGEGKVYFSKYPIEKWILNNFDNNFPCYKIYRFIVDKTRISNREIIASPFVEIIEISYKDDTLLSCINHNIYQEEIVVKKNSEIFDFISGERLEIEKKKRMLKIDDVKILKIKK